MQVEERRRRRLCQNPKGTLDEYCLRERHREDEARMKSKVSGSSGEVLSATNKKKMWSWDQYLEEERVTATPARLFTEQQSFPENRNGFKVGMRLEGIDPHHPSMFCVLSVAEVIGYRLRLHFDGYPECYDFWVNADSPDIRPAGWCEMTGRRLHPPKGYKEEEFCWERYQKDCDVQVAPKTVFKTQNIETISSFQVGMKLEAVDRKNPCLVCVASVADVIDNRFLVHFDNWDDTYDYWCDASSPHIHPVGWCQEHGKPLTAPQGHPSPEHFLWEDYLEDTGTSAVPSQGFCLRAPHRFQVNMKLEAVDRRNPMLIRVATIVDVEDYRVKVHFDGWHHKFDFWVDSDHPDLHPAGWCARTGHPLEAPPRPSDLKPSSNQGVCPTPGCRGVGHIKGARYTGHHSAFGCPYSEINMRKEVILPDRLGGEKHTATVPAQVGTGQKSKEPSGVDMEENPGDRRMETRAMLSCYEGAGRLRGRYASILRPPTHTQVKKEQVEEAAAQGQKVLPPPTKKAKLQSRLAHSTKHLKIKEEEEDIDVHTLFKECSVESMQQALHQSVFLSATTAHPGHELPLCWEQHCKLLPGVAGVQASRVAHWTVEEVATFIHSLPGCEEQAKQFKEEQIDGKAFLLLTQRDIVKIMSVKLGPALKIYNSILMFKNAEEAKSGGRDCST
ncbi:lethal(3)malignant brain tumor-like protein 4 isoform X1 [Scleropages formosus]|nr:lethal(3)malignant brain tumor-like protein 4 isoform X1 [Scleropages formosus]XP_018597262.1 lethal(3)malignant brain tumor-like protein 4 isoform X1 [Scleropages formosus]XP_018597263.1 lethal(3)malignant brain tumor-like protein 4 isoform X1 [Scleropages formosus]XP_018597264.1 lethal(3)malignant brain tumor-like protein 4 isoform X1 [Scleropages formosus]XP_018597265.1 lethal(3)malignant brain tumor-like protein 4 isoform X1 [Scleropages formosus]